MTDLVTVAIPTLNAGPAFAHTLQAVAAQRMTAEVELLVCDSGSDDGTPVLARLHGARVLEIPRTEFSHGGTRNLLMERARGTHVAFLTQDAVPANDTWLTTLLTAFDLADDVGLAFGPYLPRPDASLSVRRELTAWFGDLSPSGTPRLDRLAPGGAERSAIEFFGPLGYFTDANGCVLRSAWTRAPFRHVAYAEDHLLARDMLCAGFAKVFVPGAAVVHSHEYSTLGWLRRSFDETRGLADVYGEAHGGRWRDATLNLRGAVGADVRLARSESDRRGALLALVRSLVHHGARAAGAVLGARADRLPDLVVRSLSLERRGGAVADRSCGG